MQTSFKGFNPKIHEVIEKGVNKRLFLNKNTNMVDHVETIIVGETMTQQHHADDCDINKIMKKHRKDRAIIIDGARKGLFADLIGAPDYMESIKIIQRANDAFHTLPSSERARFENDPKKFIDYLSDKTKLDEQYDKGYRVRPQKNDDDKTTTKNAAQPVSDKKPE